MLIINTARRYRDLDWRSMQIGLFENESSPVDIAENLELFIKDKTINDMITTLNESVINRVGYLIERGYLDYKDVEIRIFENGKLKTKAGYDKEGYLNGGWIVGLYEPDELR